MKELVWFVSYLLFIFYRRPCATYLLPRVLLSVIQRGIYTASSNKSHPMLFSNQNLIMDNCSYQSLANSSLENRGEGSSNKVLSDWQLELCEPALDIQTDNSFIVVLSEKHLYCLNDNGSVEWTRKLDYHPLSLTVLTPRKNFTHHPIFRECYFIYV